MKEIFEIGELYRNTVKIGLMVKPVMNTLTRQFFDENELFLVVSGVY